jgi:hypothetical protein
MDHPPVRTPFRALSRPDASAIWVAYSKFTVGLLAVLVLLCLAVSPGSALPASTAWSDASTWTVLQNVPDSTTQISSTCTFAGTLTVAASTCVSTTRAGPPPNGIGPAGPALGYSAFAGTTYWQLWTNFGCDAAFNDSQRCNAIRYLLGYSVFTYTLLSLAICGAVLALFQFAEALLQMHHCPEERLQEFRLPSLWLRFVPLLSLTTFVFATWPIVLSAALTLLMNETIKVGEGIPNITKETVLVRPGLSWFFVLLSSIILAYLMAVNWRLEKAFPHPKT